jgi:predicted unusual protein kinase regulating ubiquinone biosynthesis (AarF/ABC1/UbiB family)
MDDLVCRRFYHADPHPGNLLKTRDGRLAYIDFGMMGSIEPSVRQALIRATLHLVNREYERLADDFVALGLLPRGSNMEEVIPALTGMLRATPGCRCAVSCLDLSRVSQNVRWFLSSKARWSGPTMISPCYIKQQA